MYEQQAVRSALRNPSEIGHLRRIKERLSEGRPQWVQRTYFSSIARSDGWWTAYLAGEDWPLQPPSPQPAAEPVASVEPVELVEEVPEPPVELEPSAEAVAAPVRASSDAYQALAALGGIEPRLTLSARECEAMESLAAEWFARGSTPAQFLSAMTAGLPGAVHSPGALVRTRLMMKLPLKCQSARAGCRVPTRFHLLRWGPGSWSAPTAGGRAGPRRCQEACATNAATTGPYKGLPGDRPPMNYGAGSRGCAAPCAPARAAGLPTARHRPDREMPVGPLTQGQGAYR